MAAGNHSTVTEFILAGLTEQPELQLPLFLLFLGIYVVTVVGNLGMIALIGLSSHLHTPMYYFLSSLSFTDLCHSTVITPKMLETFVTEKTIISYLECMTQLYFFLVFAISECYMLAAMAYDRYVAICSPYLECMTQLYFFLVFAISECYMLAAMAYDHYVAICSPLLYNVIMSYQACFSLILGVYIIGLICAFAHTGCMLRLLFCKFDVINHYFCDILPLLKLSCSSTQFNELLILIFTVINILGPSLAILSSYSFIIASILCIRSTEGRSKAFSTCSSHMLAVVVFFGSLAFTYLQPSSVTLKNQGKMSSVFYTIVVPVLNLLIYSLRNKDVNIALKKILEKSIFL
uniref:Olfactory receptor n=1 Tax=Equus asinus asinus TaxID=83772 RepID=A0A8C4L3Q4_EQUAS